MLIQIEYFSHALGYPTPIDIILPSHMAEKKFPVFYLLHGGGGDTWLRHTHVERYAKEAGVAIVMPYCRNTCWRNASVEFQGMPYEPGKVVNFEGFMTDELPRLLEKNFPISTKPEDSYIAGLSLGGYGAAFYGLTRPELYSAVGLFSAYIFGPQMFAVDRSKLSRQELLEGLMPELVEAVETAGKQRIQLPDVFMMLGTKEILELPPVFCQLLRENGAHVSYDDTSYPYGHEWDIWEHCVQDFIKWLPHRGKDGDNHVH